MLFILSDGSIHADYVGVTVSKAFFRQKDAVFRTLSMTIWKFTSRGTLLGFLGKDLVAMALHTAAVHFTSPDLRMINLHFLRRSVLNTKFWVTFLTPIT